MFLCQSKTVTWISKTNKKIVHLKKYTECWSLGVECWTSISQRHLTQVEFFRSIQYLVWKVSDVQKKEKKREEKKTTCCCVLMLHSNKKSKRNKPEFQTGCSSPGCGQSQSLTAWWCGGCWPSPCSWSTCWPGPSGQSSVASGWRSSRWWHCQCSSCIKEAVSHFQ